MPLLSRKKQFAIKQETTEGTAETLAAGDVLMEVDELEGRFTPEFQERHPLREDLSPAAGVVGITAAEITGKTELKPAAVPTNDPPCHRVLLACGLQQNLLRTGIGGAIGTFIAGEYMVGGASGRGYFVRIDATVNLTFVEIVAFAASEVATGQVSSATWTFGASPTFTTIGKAYRPNSVAPPSFTAAVMADGKKFELIGGRATCSFEVGGAGQIGYANFSMQGKAIAPVDQALFAGVAAITTVPEVFKSSAVTAEQVALVVNSFNLSLNNTLARRVASNELTGIKSVKITNRRPTIAVDPEQELEAAIPFFTRFAAGTLFGFYAQIGSTVGKRTIIVASRTQYTELGQGDRDGIATHAANLLCSRGATPGGDDDLLVCFG